MNFTYSRAEKGTELRFEGVSGAMSYGTAVGRLCVWNAHISVPDAAILCLFEPESAVFAAELIAQNAPSAIVVSSSALSSKLLCALIRSQIPHLVLKDCHYPLLEHDGRIGLLDSENGVLVINPSIETLNLYPNILPKAQTCKAREQDEISAIYEKNGKGILVDSLSIPHYLLEVTEKNCTTHITVALSVPLESFGEDEFCEYVEEIFCAAVYGNISIMLKNFSTNDELERAYFLMNKVFCSLEERGREFNGYIKKGVLVSAPSFLLLPPASRYPDFICIDADKLFSHLLACDTDELVKGRDSLRALCQIWSRFVSADAPHRPLYLRSERLCSSEFSELLESFCHFARVDEIYLV